MVGAEPFTKDKNGDLPLNMDDEPSNQWPFQELKLDVPIYLKKRAMVAPIDQMMGTVATI